jgi:hypothetical protein
LATKSIRPAAPRTTSGAPFELPEAASQTFKRGGLAKVSSNAVTVWTAITDVNLVIPLADAHNTTGATVAVADLRDGDVVEFTLYHATPASAVFASTDVNTAYGLTLVNGCAVINKADVTNKRVKILGLVREAGDDAADLYPRVIARIINASSDAGANFA